MEQPRQLKILIAPLDWGLGHATRCISIIHSLQNAGCKVLIAASGNTAALLTKEFPLLEFLPLRGYNVQYTRSRFWLPLKIARQVPRLLQTIRYEHKWLQELLKIRAVDVVISDNRYGLHAPGITSIFITHQLQIQAPAIAAKFLRKFNYKFIWRFSRCWVPDMEGPVNLAGSLSHPEAMPPIPVEYIGLLCRFSKKTVPLRFRWLAILSGPEPQRTLLEEKIMAAFAHVSVPVCIIRGKPGDDQPDITSGNITIYNHATTAEMEMLIASAEFIISRSGYTTVMEMIALEKKCLLIPTPGQTEQEYLAWHLHALHMAATCNQDDDLQAAMQQAEQLSYSFPIISSNVNAAVNRLVRSVPA
jgi:UDP-N-acetylglucosamine transferase subunit ALG13